MSDLLHTVSKALPGGFAEVVFATTVKTEIVEKFGDAAEDDAVSYYVTGYDEDRLYFTYTLENFLKLAKSKDNSQKPERNHDA